MPDHSKLAGVDFLCHDFSATMQVAIDEQKDMAGKETSFRQYLTAMNEAGDKAELYYPLEDVAAAASACKAWFASEGVAMTDVGLMAMTRLVMEQRQISRTAPVADDVTFAVDQASPSGMSWACPPQRPDLTPDKALVIALVGAASVISDGLTAMAGSLDRISDRLPDA